MLEDFDGQASNLVRAANHSARKLVTIITRHFPGFRDSCVYQGKQVFLYKRYVGWLLGVAVVEASGYCFGDVARVIL